MSADSETSPPAQVATSPNVPPPFLPLPDGYSPQRSASDAMRSFLGPQFIGAADIIEDHAQRVWSKIGVPRGQSLDECIVLVLYTADLQSLCGAARENAFFFVLNMALRSQDATQLSPGSALADLYWYLLSALGKVPCEPPGTVVWQCLNAGLASLNSSYPVNGYVRYTAFTSTTGDLSSVLGFVPAGRGRTVARIVSSEARSIRQYSQFQEEDELLLLSNSVFVVNAALESTRVASFPGVNLPGGVDLIAMTQIPTATNTAHRDRERSAAPSVSSELNN